MVFSSLPSLLGEKLKISGNFWNTATAREELHPAEETWAPPAFYLDEEDLARVERSAEFFPLELELQRSRGGKSLSPPIMRFHFRDLLILGGDVFSRGIREPYRRGTTHRWFVGEVPTLSSAFLASTPLGSAFFGHWLIDDLALAQLSGGSEQRFFLAERLSAHQNRYMQLLGIDIPPLLNARIRDCTLVEDGRVQGHKANRLGQFRRTIRGSVGDSPPVRGVMLLRKQSGRSRLLMNEMAIAEALEKRGFSILDPMGSTVDEIQRHCSKADVVVGVEGSHMTHALFSLQPDKAFLTIQPPFKFDHTCKQYADGLGLKYGFTVGLPVAGGGFVAEPERVWALVEKVTSAPLTKASFANV